jgi:hypothetical protein
MELNEESGGWGGKNQGAMLRAKAMTTVTFPLSCV